MNIPIANSLFFLFALSAGIAMVGEAWAILMLKKQITPLPTRVLSGLMVLLASEERGFHPTAKTDARSLRDYAKWVLFFGPLVVVSSFIYLFSSVL